MGVGNRERFCPSDVHFHVASVVGGGLNQERPVFGIHRDSQIRRRPHPKGITTNADGQARGFVEFYRRICMRKCHGRSRLSPAQDPKVRQGNTLRHPPEIGPAAPETLQWPSTASSGRRLTRTTWGGW